MKLIPILLEYKSEYSSIENVSTIIEILFFGQFLTNLFSSKIF